MLGLGLNLWNPALFGGAFEDADMELIESGTISSPVEYLDIDLPSGYSLFKLVITDLLMSTNDELAAAFSADGGVNFLSDQDNFDSYRTKYVRFFDNTQAGENSDDTLLRLAVTGAHDVGYPHTVEAWINPGSASEFAAIFSRHDRVNSTSPLISLLSSVIIGDATNPPTKRRYNGIRLSPYGNGDIDPPTSEETLTGTYFLYGVPTP